MSTQYGSSKKGGRDERVYFQIAQADLIANNGVEISVPVDGYLTGLYTTVQANNTAAGTVTVKTGDTLATTVSGLSVAVAAGAVKGTRGSAASTPNDVTTTKVKAGDRLQVATSGFATAGALNGHIKINTMGPIT